MKHKKSIQKHELKKETGKQKEVKRILVPKWFVLLLLFSLLANIIWLVITIMPAKSLKKDLEFAASRAYFSIVDKVPKVITDDENSSFSIKFAELWENQLQRMNGYICEFPLSHFPDCSMILDGELKIVSIGSLEDITLAGKSQYLGGYFSKLYGLDIRSLAGNSGVFKPDEKELTVYAEQFKASLLKAMKLAYIQVKGMDEFNNLFPNGMNLASVGDYLKKFSAVDFNGISLSTSDLKSKKNALISVDVGCGACKSKCASMRDLLSAGDVNVIFISDGNEEDTKSFITEYVRSEKVILDPDKKVSAQLYMGDPPYLMLIDKDLKIFFKSEISDVAKDAEPAINAFIK
jgi:peroxiredoxin